MHPALRENIDSLDDIIGLVDEMFSTHRDMYADFLSGSSDLSNTLMRLSSCLDTYVSYSMLINSEQNNIQVIE